MKYHVLIVIALHPSERILDCDMLQRWIDSSAEATRSEGQDNHKVNSPDGRERKSTRFVRLSTEMRLFGHAT